MASLAEGIGGLMALEKEEGVQQPLRLLTMMIDDSTSMHHYDNFRVVMAGHNGVLDALQASAQAPLFLARTQYMHGKALAQGYLPLNRAVRMDEQNYQLIGGTPLFKATRRILWYVQRSAREFTREGNDVRTLTLLLTDGWNRGSDALSVTVEQTAKVVRPMIKSGRHIVAGVGVGNPFSGVDFRQVFLAMGIPEQWILTLRSAEEIKAAFATFAQSAERSSVSRAAFDETVLEGFAGTVK